MARLKARPTVAKLICEGCGCTDAAACPGGCHWVSRDPPVCSRCLDPGDLANAEADGAELVDEGFFDTERCPASDVPALHLKIFADPTSGYCARCHAGFVA